MHPFSWIGDKTSEVESPEERRKRLLLGAIADMIQKKCACGCNYCSRMSPCDCKGCAHAAARARAATWRKR